MNGMVHGKSICTEIKRVLEIHRYRLVRETECHPGANKDTLREKKKRVTTGIEGNSSHPIPYQKH